MCSLMLSKCSFPGFKVRCVSPCFAVFRRRCCTGCRTTVWEVLGLGSGIMLPLTWCVSTYTLPIIGFRRSSIRFLSVNFCPTIWLLVIFMETHHPLWVMRFHEYLVNGRDHQVRSIILNEVAAILGDHEPASGTSSGEIGLQTHPGPHIVCCCPMCRWSVTTAYQHDERHLGKAASCCIYLRLLCLSILPIWFFSQCASC